MNRTITLSSENYNQQLNNLKQLMSIVKITNWSDVYKEIKGYENYLNDIQTVNENISAYNNGRIDSNQLKAVVQNVQSMSNNEYSKQFNELLDELSSTNNITEEVEALLKSMEGM